jgi:hypothetical protein
MVSMHRGILGKIEEFSKDFKKGMFALLHFVKVYTAITILVKKKVTFKILLEYSMYSQKLKYQKTRREKGKFKHLSIV